MGKNELGLTLVILVIEFLMLFCVTSLSYLQSAVASIVVFFIIRLTTDLPRILLWRIRVMTTGAIHFVLSSEKKGMSKLPDPILLGKCDEKTLIRKRIVFIRHGESEWNEMFNKSKLPWKIIPRLVRGVLRELSLFTVCDSIFYDSPLSAEGVDQALTLQRFLANSKPKGENELDKYLFFLQGVRQFGSNSNDGTSIVVSSNLRRALATTAIGLWGRLQIPLDEKNKTDDSGSVEKVVVLQTLQEMSRNVDTLAIAQPRDVPALPVLSRELGAAFAPTCASERFDCTACLGNKAWYRKGSSDLFNFAKWACARDEECIIAGGHSLWFKQFYRQFLPRKSKHKSKTSKMVNAGVIGFVLTQGTTPDGLTVFQIEEDSMTTVYGGYK